MGRDLNFSTSKSVVREVEKVGVSNYRPTTPPPFRGWGVRVGVKFEVLKVEKIWIMKRHENCRRCGGALVDRIAPKSGKKLRYCPACHGTAKRLARSIRPDRYQAQQQAHKAVHRALRLGQISRRPCADCGAPETEGHHDDYAKPLEVVWLCRTHHRRRHIAMKGKTQ